MSILSDIDFLYFCADMEHLDSLEALDEQIPSQQSWFNYFNNFNL